MKWELFLLRFKNIEQLPAPLPFDIRIIKEQKHILTKLLQACGKLYARPHPELNEEGEGIHLVWKLLGPTDSVLFGDTIIKGNSNLPHAVIERELAYKKGELWDQRKIEKSVARLKKLGIFDAVTLAPEDLGTPELSKNLLLKYVEDFPYEVRTRLGIQGVNCSIVNSVQKVSHTKLVQAFWQKIHSIGVTVFSLMQTSHATCMMSSSVIGILHCFRFPCELK